MKNIKIYLLLLVFIGMAVACEKDPYAVPDIEQVPVKKIYEISYEIDGKEITSKDDARIPFSITLYDTDDMMTWYKDARRIVVKKVTNKDESASTDEEFIISFDTVESIIVVDAEGNESTEEITESFLINASKTATTHGSMDYTFIQDGTETTRTYKVRVKEDKVYN